MKGKGREARCDDYSAYIGNLGKYNEGILAVEPLRFPASTEEVQAVLSKIGVDGIRYEESLLPILKLMLPGCRNHLGEGESIDELNYLASLLDELDNGQSRQNMKPPSRSENIPGALRI
ncbi:MAG: antirestriction protein ArdA [Enterocloster bolteae]